MLNLSKELLEELAEHFESEYPREGCGVFAIFKGRLKWFPCTNLANNNDDFIMDSKQYLEIKRTLGDEEAYKYAQSLIPAT